MKKVTKIKTFDFQQKFQALMTKINPGRLTLEYVFAAFLSAFAVATSYAVLKTSCSFYDLNFVNMVNYFWFVMILAIIFFVQLVLVFLLKRKAIIPYCLLLFSLFLSVILVVKRTEDIYFNLGLAFILGLIAFWCSKDDKLELKGIKISYRHCFYFACGCFLFYTLVVSYFTIIRYKGYGASTYDFGIFIQMFENMKNTGLPMTTVEFNPNHFGVHFSPFFYLLLPGYFLWSSAEYLLITQALAVGLGVFVIYKICKTIKIKPGLTLGIMLIYLFLPSMIAGSMYDFHENKFLTLPILLMVYYLLKKNNLLVMLFALLVLMIKEDAVVYVIAISLFMIFGRKEYLLGSVLVIGSIAYFILAYILMHYLGTGLMIGRYANLIPPDNIPNLLSIIKTCFFNFPYLLTIILSKEKIEFILWLMLPLLFVPLFTKRIAYLLLLVPILIINLLSSWPYQYNINYQYTFGIMALIMFLFILIIKEFKSTQQSFIALAGVMITLVLCFSLNYHRLLYYHQVYFENQEDIKYVDECLAKLPKDVSITATNWLVPHLYKYKELYLAWPPEGGDFTDYYIFDPRDEDAVKLLNKYLDYGYERVAGGRLVEIYKKPKIMQ